MAEDETPQDVPAVRAGDTWESMDPAEDAPRRRVKVLEVVDGHARVENMSSWHLSSVRLDRLAPPYWRFVG